MQTEFHMNPLRTSTSLPIQVSELGIQMKDESPITWKLANKTFKNASLNASQVVDISVEIIHPAFLLLPAEYNDPLYRVAFLEKALGPTCMDGNELHEQTCKLVNSTLLFLIPSDWKDQLSILFPLANIQYNHLLANNLTHTKLYIHPRIHIYLQEQHAYITFFQHGKLQLINVFPYENEVALAYYLHAIRETYDIQWNHESIQLMGPESANKQLLSELIRLKIPLS